MTRARLKGAPDRRMSVSRHYRAGHYNMAFQSKDAAMLEKVKKGDKVKFKATMSGSAMVVTEIQSVK